MQFVSLIRPSPMENGSLSTSVAEILQVIQGNQNCNRTSLAATILGADESAIDPARKSTLATDLRWLIETGRVIEFSDGRLELPVSPAKSEPPKAEAPAVKPTRETSPEAVVEVVPEPEPLPELALAPVEELPTLDPVATSAESPAAES